MEEIKIVEFNNRFQSGVQNLILDIQQNEYNIPITKEDQPDLREIEYFYVKNNGNFWVALCQDEVVGTIGLLNRGSNQGVLRKMFVKKEFRGKSNTAFLLLKKLMDWAKQNNFKDIFLGTTEQFLAAHRFYEKHGFIQILQSDLPKQFPVMNVDTRFYKFTLIESN